MNKDKYDGWKNPHSGYNVQKSGDQLVVTGSYYYRGIEYRYSLRQQSNGPWVMSHFAGCGQEKNGTLKRHGGDARKAAGKTEYYY